MPRREPAILAAVALMCPVLLIAPSSWSQTAVISELAQKAAGATYSQWLCYTQLIDVGFGRTPNGCTWEEYAGNNWHHWERGSQHRFDFPGNGTIRFVSIDFVESVPEATLIGTPRGRSILDIVWECPKPRWGAGRAAISEVEPAWVRMSEDLSSLVATCGVSHPAAYPLARLQYAWYRRN